MSEIINNYAAEKAKFDLAHSALYNKTDEIIRLIAHVLLNKAQQMNLWWDWEYCDDGEASLPEVRGDSIDVYVSTALDDGYWFYNEAIPTKFYDMTDEEITSFIRNNIEKKKKEELKKKEKALQQKEKKRQNQKLQEQKKLEVLNKLSEEDRKILGLS